MPEMPELPEVETIARRLRHGTSHSPPLPGQRIERAILHWPRHVVTPSPAAFRRRIKAQIIRDVQRRGKFLLFPLSEGTLIIHLRMSGDLEIAARETPADRFERTVFVLQSGWALRFNDARKFGQVYLLDDPQELFAPLGPEPLDPRFTAKKLADLLSGRRGAIKPLLLSQNFIAGMGNIYADEALHLAGLHPLRTADSLSPGEIHALWLGIRKALRMGLRSNGASIDWVYRGGQFQDRLRVYQRTGQACRSCGTPIRRIVVGQRGTHYCPHCQPERDQ
jgi:formamidopyrimidine-DNA glycosylase